MDIFGDQVELVPFSDGLFETYEKGCVDVACAPATTSLVGTTPYLDQILSLRSARIIAEYPKRLCCGITIVSVSHPSSRPL
ncbi:hypothetical protein CK222_04010 [Mesorhizobium sp. WSM3866]|nr:hypothetical protein CK214_24810 [Mesorhizobium sp. WSM3882]PBB37955.1 hypothetical protein CK221_08225 [Mesorhizobium sp. WSM3868]PBB45627.1 hypothetical protein CK222_04010 [Mesorhizobium sp. WSM3866]PBB58301.1 hypothetical protein CK217_30440 [Mesorhizobium loti]PBB78459.1 hypothetical protein CK218_24125 [Mesorhizobium sp. WSM3879]PBB85343.1 hypothetical protein CK216_19220 [Mesorhizobium sp. WSM3876]PBB90319.1 hypothetical protein CK215_21925 [Mesorhizobium sp. WSM3864]